MFRAQRKSLFALCCEKASSNMFNLLSVSSVQFVLLVNYFQVTPPLLSLEEEDD